VALPVQILFFDPALLAEHISGFGRLSVSSEHGNGLETIAASARVAR
jgi:hypothetical protein